MSDDKIPLITEDGEIISEDYIDETLQEEELFIPEEDRAILEAEDQAEEPTYEASANRKFKILIDPGHFGGYNKGAIAGYAEGTAMFILGRHLKQALLEYPNVEAAITRQKLEDNPTLDQRGKKAKGFDVFVSLHSDGFNSPSAIGVSVFYSVRRPKSKPVAEKLGKELTKLINASTGVTKFRGAKTRSYPNNVNIDYYGVIRSSVMNQSVQYSFLIEHGFHSNPKECGFLNKDENLKTIAKLEAKILMEALGNTGVKPTNPKPAPAPTPKPKTEPAPDKGGETYAVLKKDGIPGYISATDAMGGKNKKSHVPYGTYKVYKRHVSGAINITNKAGTPGSWINPNDNVKDSSPSVGSRSDLTALTISDKNKPEISKEQAVAFIEKKTKGGYKLSVSLEELINNYIKCGEIEGIRWDVALCQAIHETGYFKYGGIVKPEQNNYCGMGAGNNTIATFKTSFDGVMAHIQHLKGYANKDTLVYDMIDPRFKYVERGYSPYLEWLGRDDNPNNSNKPVGSQIGWAIPGKGYGKIIRGILDQIIKS